MPKPPTRQDARRTPIATTNVRGTWPRKTAIRTATREAAALTRALTTPGHRQDALAYILGMQMLRTTSPTLVATLRDATTDTERRQLALDALRDPVAVWDTLDAFAVPTVDDVPRTPNGIGKALALQLGSEIASATRAVIDPTTTRLLATVASHPSLPSLALDALPEYLHSGFLLLPEDLLLAPSADAPHPLDIRAMSWAPGRTPGGDHGIRIALWAQSYGPRAETGDADWTALLERSREDHILLPRLTYVATDWLIDDEPVPGDPVHEDVGATDDGELLVLDPAATFPRRFLAALFTTAAAGALLADWVDREGRPVVVLAAAEEDETPPGA